MRRPVEEIKRMIERLAIERQRAFDSGAHMYAHHYDSILEGLHWVLGGDESLLDLPENDSIRSQILQKMEEKRRP